MRISKLRIAAGLLVCLVLIGVTPAGIAQPASDPNCTSALVIAEWQPLVTLAGGPPAASALAELKTMIGLQRLIALHTEPDAPAAALRNRLWKAFRDYDLSTFYKTLPESDPPWRAVTFDSQAANGAYVVSVADDAHTADSALNTLGDTYSRLAAKPSHDAQSGNGFALEGRIDSDIGPMSWPVIRHAVEQLLLRGAAPVPIAAPASAQTAVVETFPTLDPRDRPHMAQLWYGLPATWQWYGQIGRITSLTGSGVAPTGLHHLHYSASLDKKGLAARYPAVAGYIDQLNGLVKARVTITSAAGQWLQYTVDSSNRQVTLDAWVNDAGHLVPTVDGQPEPAAALGDDPSSGRFDMRMDSSMHSFGLTVNMRDLVIHWRFARTAKGAQFIGRINDVPRTTVTGRALGIIPTGVLNALMPSNMAAFANRFMVRLAHSDNGRGARLALTLSDQDGDNRLQFSGEGDLEDNFFARFGVRMMNNRMLPDAKQLADFHQMMGDALTAFAHDRDRRAAIANVDAGCAID